MTTSTSAPRIVAVSRQTRFNPLVQGDASEIDLNDVDITIAEREILVDARIRLKNGVRYGMIGRNGCGKSSKLHNPCALVLISGQVLIPIAVLQAIAEKMIPGIPPSLRIHIVSQVSEGGSEKESEAGQRTAMQRVLDGHVERTNALKQREGTWYRYE